MIDLILEAASIQSFIESKHWNFFFIGGIPVQIWGQPRLTQDVDLTIFTELRDEPVYINAFLERYKPKFSDALEYALANRVLPLFTESGIGIDVTLSGLSDTSEALQRSSFQEFAGDLSLRVCSAEDLLIMKTVAGRDRDWIDIESVIIRQNSLDWHYVMNTLESLTDNDELPPRIERLKVTMSNFYQK
jgi:hypothetical protein